MDVVHLVQRAHEAIGGQRLWGRAVSATACCQSRPEAPAIGEHPAEIFPGRTTCQVRSARQHNRAACRGSAFAPGPAASGRSSPCCRLHWPPPGPGDGVLHNGIVRGEKLNASSNARSPRAAPVSVPISAPSLSLVSSPANPVAHLGGSRDQDDDRGVQDRHAERIEILGHCPQYLQKIEPRSRPQPGPSAPRRKGPAVGHGDADCRFVVSAYHDPHFRHSAQTSNGPSRPSG